MDRTERKRSYLETLYIQYRVGKIALSEVLRVSREMDCLVNKYYMVRGKIKRFRHKKNKEYKGRDKAQ